MKILQLCNKIPYPSTDGGAIAVLNMALSLSEAGHEVHILAMNTHKHHAGMEDIPDEWAARIRFMYVETDTRIRIGKLLANLIFSRLPYNATRFRSRIFARELTEILKTESFDLVEMEGLYLCSYIGLIRKLHPGKVVYRAHNVESDIWSGRAVSEKNLIRKAYLTIIAKRMNRYEWNFINKYDILLPITATDHAKFTQWGNTKPAHITLTGILENAWLKSQKSGAVSNLFFIGALDWIPNQEGLIWFLDRVWPLLIEEYPELNLHIAGRNAPAWIQERCRAVQIIFHGEVENAHHFMDRYDLMIVPLFTGSGLRIKIVEAMARSCLIITTPAGARGLPQLRGEEIIIEEEASRWKEQICMLMNNRDRCKATSREAYAYAKEYFSNKAIITKLLYFYNQQGIC